MALDTVSPRDCELLLGIPLSGEELLADLERPGHEYARICLDKLRAEFRGASERYLAREYERLVALSVLALAEKMAAWGVRLEKSATRPAVARAFARSRVVGLMAHSPAVSDEALLRSTVAEQSAWRCLELRDGFVTIADLAEAIPPGWDGIVDLIACESSAHAHALKARRPATSIIVNRRHAEPVLRLHRFDACIALIRHQPQPYGDALVAVLESLRSSAHA